MTQWHEHANILKFKTPDDWTVDDSDNMTRIFANGKPVMVVKYIILEDEESFDDDCDHALGEYIRENNLKVENNMFYKYKGVKRNFAYCDGTDKDGLVKLWSASRFPVMALGIYRVGNDEDEMYAAARVMDSMKFRNAFNA